MSKSAQVDVVVLIEIEEGGEIVENQKGLTNLSPKIECETE